MTTTRVILWVLLAVSAAANIVTSTAGLNPLIDIGFGLLTLAFGGTLIAQHYRRRRSG